MTLRDTLGRLFNKSRQPEQEHTEKFEITDQPECVIVVDRSGSMESVRDDAIETFNSYVDGLKQDCPDSLITAIQFSDSVKVMYSGSYVRTAPPMSRDNYNPIGATALYDAIGEAVRSTARRGENRKVIVAILTDGEENSSRTYTRVDINRLIEKYEALGWAFIFLGAGFTQERAESMANSVGIKSANSMGIKKVNLKKASSNMRSAYSSYMDTGQVGVDWRKQN